MEQYKTGRNNHAPVYRAWKGSKAAARKAALGKNRIGRLLRKLLGSNKNATYEDYKNVMAKIDSLLRRTHLTTAVHRPIHNAFLKELEAALDDAATVDPPSDKDSDKDKKSSPKSGNDNNGGGGMGSSGMIAY